MPPQPANGAVKYRLEMPIPRQMDECWIPAACGPFPDCKYKGSLPFQNLSDMYVTAPRSDHLLVGWADYAGLAKGGQVDGGWAEK